MGMLVRGKEHPRVGLNLETYRVLDSDERNKRKGKEKLGKRGRRLETILVKM